VAKLTGLAELSRDPSPGFGQGFGADLVAEDPRSLPQGLLYAFSVVILAVGAQQIGHRGALGHGENGYAGLMATVVQG